MAVRFKNGGRGASLNTRLCEACVTGILWGFRGGGMGFTRCYMWISRGGGGVARTLNPKP